ncbi:AMP-binding protein [Pseudomonas aeruginosa]|nr:AMP-binding protein [Pseudomonas aeruginosa]
MQAYLGNYPGYYHTGDGGYLDEDGFVYIMGRTDDVINVSGHRLSTGEMEERVAQHQAVAECAVIGVRTNSRATCRRAGGAQGRCRDRRRATAARAGGAGPRTDRPRAACFQRVVVVKRLPKTRSGKILRAVLRKIADGEDYAAPSTIDDPTILGEIEAALRVRKAG